MSDPTPCPACGETAAPFFPRSRSMRGASALWMLFACALIAWPLRGPTQHIVSDDTLKAITTGALIAALAATLVAVLLDLRTPSGHCLEGERIAQAVIAIGFLMMSVVLVFHDATVFAPSGLAVVVAGGFIDYFTKRGPGHPARGFSASEAVVSLMVLLVLAAIAVPNFKRPRTHSPTRACYANQKTLAGAIEMYNLDKNTKRSPLDDGFYKALLSGGYLQSMPNHPFEGPGTQDRYRLTDTGELTCVQHGEIPPARRQEQRPRY